MTDPYLGCNTFQCPCGRSHDAALRDLSLECAAYPMNGVDLCRLDVAEDLHRQIVDVALIADNIEHSAQAMMRHSRCAEADGDICGAGRESCIAAREYDWAAKLWDAIGMGERARRCRDRSNAVRAGEYKDPK